MALRRSSTVRHTVHLSVLPVARGADGLTTEHPGLDPQSYVAWSDRRYDARAGEAAYACNHVSHPTLHHQYNRSWSRAANRRVGQRPPHTDLRKRGDPLRAPLRRRPRKCMGGEPLPPRGTNVARGFGRKGAMNEKL